MDMIKNRATINIELLECLEDFECVDADFRLTDFGKEVAKELEAGIGR